MQVSHVLGVGPGGIDEIKLKSKPQYYHLLRILAVVSESLNVCIAP